MSINNSQLVDLSGFPVIRIDQIPLVSSDTLQSAMVEVNELIASLLAESSTVPPMVHYLRKQNEAMSAELADRSAKERIQALLRGIGEDVVTAQDVRSRLPLSVPANASSSNREPNAKFDPNASQPRDKIEMSTSNGLTGTVSESDKNYHGAFKPLPLPSELSRMKGASDSDGSSKHEPSLPRVSTSRSVDDRITSPYDGNEADNEDTDAGSGSLGERRLRRRHTSLDSTATSARGSSPSTIAGLSTARSEGSADPTPIAFGASGSGSGAPGSGSGKPRREPRSRTTGISFRPPPKASLDVFNENFGKMFIVPNVDGSRRRRIAPAKKEPQLSVEEVKNNERLERRKAAMKRLMDRKEERQQYQMKKKEEQRKAAAARDAANARAAAAASEAACKTVKQTGKAESEERGRSTTMSKQTNAAAVSRASSKPSSGGATVTATVKATVEAPTERSAPIVATKIATKLKSAEDKEETISGAKSQPQSESQEQATAEDDNQDQGRNRDQGGGGTSGSYDAHEKAAARKQKCNVSGKGEELPVRVGMGAGLGVGVDATKPTAADAGDIDDEVSESNRQKADSASKTTETDGDGADDAVNAHDESDASVDMLDVGSSSGSETVSGGDDDYGVEIDAHLVEVVAQAQLVQGQEQEEQEWGQGRAVEDINSNGDDNYDANDDDDDDDEPIGFKLDAEVAAKSSAALSMLRLMKSRKQQFDSSIDDDARGESSNEAETVSSCTVYKRSGSSGNTPGHVDFNVPSQDRREETQQELARARVESVEAAGNDAVISRAGIASLNLDIGALKITASQSTRLSAADPSADPGDSAETGSASVHDSGRYAASPDSAAQSLSSRPHSSAAGIAVATALSASTLTSTAPVSATGVVETDLKEITLPGLRTAASESALEHAPQESAAATAATARSMLMGVTQSRLLFLRDGDGSYCTRRGVDDLPGLAAWKLASVVKDEVEWVASVATYNKSKEVNYGSEPSGSQLFKNRSKITKTVSIGLVLLLLDCESLLLGQEPLFSDAHLSSLWAEHIRAFDEKADFAALQFGPEALFSSVSVCGNCHAACRKLEHLLKTHFSKVGVHDIGGTSRQGGDDPTLGAGTAIEFSAASSMRQRLCAQPSNQDLLGLASPHSAHSPLTAKSKRTSEGGHLLHSSSVDAIKSPGAGAEAAASEEGITRSREIVDSNLRNTDDDDDDDADASILPSYNFSRMAEPYAAPTQQQPLRSSGEAISVAAQAAATTFALGRGIAQDSTEFDSLPGHQSNAPTNALTDASTPSSTRTLTGVVDGVDRAPPAGKSSKGVAKGPKLSDYYPNIGMLFPAAYSQVGASTMTSTGSRAVPDDGGRGARTLLESMQVQTRVYEEWMEVMSDYATVFSDDYRGVAENYRQQQQQQQLQQSGDVDVDVDVDGDRDGTSAASGIGSDRETSAKRGRRPRGIADTTDGDDADDATGATSDPSRDQQSGGTTAGAGAGAGAGSSTATGNAAVYQGGSRSLHFRVNSVRPEVYNIVADVFHNQLPGWEELPTGLGLGLSWNVLWTWSKPRIKMSHLLVWQRVNHYPDSRQLTRKDLLKKNIQRYTKMGSKAAAEFEIMPQTYILPHEYTAFVQAFTAQEARKASSGVQNYWILKPIGMSRGRGISLVKDLSQISYSSSSVVQQYVERPLCLHGYKFDLRLYVLVTSFKPLEAFIYREGFARVSTHKYSLNEEDLQNKYIHLTNSSIQKMNTEGPSDDNPLSSTHPEDSDDTGGSKISLLGKRGLWQRLKDFNVDVDKLWGSICILVLKSLVITDDKMVHQACCFEMFGFDVLVDADLRPWLIEVNASPSLARMNALDGRVKEPMIRDIITLLDPAPFDRAAVLRVLQRRLASLAKNRFSVGRNDAELERDLRDILGSYVPRRYGEEPKAMGNYQMLCPNTEAHAHVLKLRKKIIKS